MKKSKNNNIILVIGFLNLVSVDAKERSLMTIIRELLLQKIECLCKDFRGPWFMEQNHTFTTYFQSLFKI